MLFENIMNNIVYYGDTSFAKTKKLLSVYEDTLHKIVIFNQIENFTVKFYMTYRLIKSFFKKYMKCD